MMQTREYKFFHGRPLQDWYTLKIEEHELPEDQQYHAPGTSQLVKTRKEAVFLSRIHERKEFRPTFSWSGTFSDGKILNDSDLLRVIHQAYGDVWA